MKFKLHEKVIIVGCGRLGASLAYELSGKGYQVILIDKKEEAFRKLPESFSGFKITGDGTDTDLLESVDIKEAAMVIAVTESDNTNSLIAQVASKIYSKQRIYIRLSDTEKEVLIKDLNIQAIYPFLLSMNELKRLIFNNNGEDN